jgi:hypothetical protein
MYHAISSRPIVTLGRDHMHLLYAVDVMEVGAGAAFKCEMVGKLEACTTRKEPILE